MNNPYKYGIVLLTNDRDAIVNLKAADGIYVAIETPEDGSARTLDRKIWLESWLDESKRALWTKLKKDMKK